MSTQAALERAILNVITARGGKPLPVSVIKGFTPSFTGQDDTEADITAALKRMEAEGEVKGTSNKDYGTVWLATDAGKLRIA
jgi:hypothetical protein